ncbi:hypothetical protein NP603_05325 [Methylomonas sp. SURF-1]|uniref:Uncharacterized protein n=1 Tax=Methylomonas aurea TaxID=2952224 RepID=A0ABT1UE63_9GAMM|nr:hypothetical protein [Methylomonas sp. SURF-1]MCQ8180517.1 hypothetical protein [Methylomonas sp. SURF-1]
MTRQRQAATGRNREAAFFRILQRNFTGTIKRIKLEFIRLPVWWRIAWGVLL